MATLRAVAVALNDGSLVRLGGPLRRGGSSQGAMRRHGSSSNPGQGLATKLRSLFGSSRTLPQDRPPVQLGRVSPRRSVPEHVVKPPYALTGRLPPPPSEIVLHGPESQARMRAAGRLARKMLDYACSLARVGVTTEEIDAAVHEAIVSHGAYPSPLNYMGFPKAICSSVNEVVIHGIPDDRPLRDGDVVSFDVSLFLDGVHGDNCATVCVGSVDEAGWRLVEAARRTLDEALAVCKPGACLTEIGEAVARVGEEEGVALVKTYSGHGVGEQLHMFPLVLHYRNRERLELRPGMVFTIEPMVIEGKDHRVDTLEDGWTVVSRSGGRGAQFEHTVLITDTGVEVLTCDETGGTAQGGSFRDQAQKTPTAPPPPDATAS